jgi:hypothetical protein
MKRTPLQRRTPLRRVSLKRQRVNRERRELVRSELMRRPRCEAGHLTPASCSGYATDIHEPLTRARGGPILDPANTVAICRACHDWIHDNPQSATRIGLLKPSWGNGHTLATGGE